MATKPNTNAAVTAKGKRPLLRRRHATIVPTFVPIFDKDLGISCTKATDILNLFKNGDGKGNMFGWNWSARTNHGYRSIDVIKIYDVNPSDAHKAAFRAVESADKANGYDASTLLWHGTGCKNTACLEPSTNPRAFVHSHKDCTFAQIVENGFRGRGKTGIICLSPTAPYSIKYTPQDASGVRSILLCRVLKGKTTRLQPYSGQFIEDLIKTHDTVSYASDGEALAVTDTRRILPAFVICFKTI